MRLLVNTASCGLVAMALASPLFFGGCDASKAELQATQTKLAAVTMERDGLKAQLDRRGAVGVAANLLTGRLPGFDRLVVQQPQPPAQQQDRQKQPQHQQRPAITGR